ncbi:MAG: zinc ribbon domain-containing protein [Halanaerobiaceae bacterium]
MEDKIYFIVPIIIALLLQSIWIFYDARRRREKHYWLWGLFGLLNFPSSLIVYLVVTRIFIDRGKQKCPDCGTELKDNWNYCPHCSREIKRIKKK